ncbi:ras-related protein Rab-7L1 [Lingula anatina]|uniref:Ras-related protein Rab n=1 Tax=Lingula anatina TaxID=7574 RepID=A0A1S3HDH3_LINAN|nr:ras-related protein Rab-7L1 [Lingula anatina]|eukprot:XP_013384092.1 ras-related protein Rab-7L1 [Lingula anatina]
MEKLFKVIIIGDPTVGKTSFVQRYVNDSYRRDYKGTIGVDFALKVVKWSDRETVKLQLWDIAGQERFTSMTRVYYKDAHACIIMFDLLQKSTFNNAIKWKKDLDSKCTLPDGSNVPCLLLGNKCDLHQQRKVDQEEIETMCKENEFLDWKEISVKENIMIEESMRCLLEDMLVRHVDFDHSMMQSQNTGDGAGRAFRIRPQEPVEESGSKCPC